MVDKDLKGRYLEEESSRWRERVETHLACLRSSSRIVWPELGEETCPLNGIIYTKRVAVPGTSSRFPGCENSTVP